MDPNLLDIAQLWWDESLVVKRASGSCETVLDLPAEELLGRPLATLLGIDEPVARNLDFKARHPAAGQPTSVEFVRRRRGGEVAWLRLRLALSDGSATAAVVDVNDLLEGAPPLQFSRLSSSLSHELRNPLSSVKMAVQTLARNPGHSERDQRRLVIANREVRTLERMLWLLSEYGRDSFPHMEAVSLSNLVAEATALIDPELTERRIRVQVEYGPHAESAKVRAESARLRPVLAQLFLNVAMGQSEGSAVALTLSIDSRGVSLAVWDPAASPPAEERARLFEPFGSMLARGAGLSLAALHRTMQNHGGSVSADPGAGGGVGTVYTLRFPPG
jgi:two-component system sensor histidine kinase HydH